MVVCLRRRVSRASFRKAQRAGHVMRASTMIIKQGPKKFPIHRSVPPRSVLRDSTVDCTMSKKRRGQGMTGGESVCVKGVFLSYFEPCVPSAKLRRLTASSGQREKETKLSFT